jgi:hypothetical protein
MVHQSLMINQTDEARGNQASDLINQDWKHIKPHDKAMIQKQIQFHRELNSFKIYLAKNYLLASKAIIKVCNKKKQVDDV